MVFKNKKRQQTKIMNEIFDDMFGYRYVVRLNKETNKYELFECIRKPRSKYYYQDVSVDNKKLFIEYNLSPDIEDGRVEKFKDAEQQNIYGPSSRMLCFINEHFESLEFNLPHTVANVYQVFNKCTFNDFKTIINKVNEKQAKYSQQKNLESSDQKETLISEKVR